MSASIRGRSGVLLFLVLASACSARFSGNTPRPYKCGSAEDGGSSECVGGWRCNATVGVCIDPEVGLPMACRNDFECGGGWRCSPNGACVDRSVEGEVSTAGTTSPAEFISPLVTAEGDLHTSQPQTSVFSDGYVAVGSDVFFDGTPAQWVSVEDFVGPDGVVTQYVVGMSPTATDRPRALSTRVTPSGGFTHTLWVATEQGLVSLSRENGVIDAGLVPGRFTDVHVLRGANLAAAPEDPLQGAVVAEKESGAATYVAGTRDAGLMFALPVSDLAWAPRTAGCEAKLYRATAQGLTESTESGGSTVLDPDAPAELRIGANTKTGAQYIAWRSNDGGLSWRDVCETTVNTAPSCPHTNNIVRQLVGWHLEESGTGMTPVRLCENGAQQALVQGVSGTSVETIYNPISVSSEGTTLWGRARSTGAVVRIEPTGSVIDVTLAEPPDALIRAGANVVACRSSGSFVLTPSLGFLRARTMADPLDNFATGFGTFVVTRNGVVLGADWAVAFPRVDWNEPRAPVLARGVALGDGGTLLALSHDDTIDMAQLKIAEREAVELTPTLIPAPGFAVSDFALHAPGDGGTPVGLAVAGGTISALTSTTPTRWQTNKITLPSDALHVWFDQEHPRAVMTDGTVVGLTAIVALTPPTPTAAIAATSVCGTPFVLTDSALYHWADTGWQSVADLPGDVGFTGGRLLTLGTRLYVFEKSGHVWQVDVKCP